MTMAGETSKQFLDLGAAFTLSAVIVAFLFPALIRLLPNAPTPKDTCAPYHLISQVLFGGGCSGGCLVRTKQPLSATGCELVGHTAEACTRSVGRSLRRRLASD